MNKVAEMILRNNYNNFVYPMILSPNANLNGEQRLVLNKIIDIMKYHKRNPYKVQDLLGVTPYNVIYDMPGAKSIRYSWKDYCDKLSKVFKSPLWGYSGNCIAAASYLYNFLENKDIEACLFFMPESEKYTTNGEYDFHTICVTDVFGKPLALDVDIPNFNFKNGMARVLKPIDFYINSGRYDLHNSLIIGSINQEVVTWPLACWNVNKKGIFTREKANTYLKSKNMNAKQFLVEKCEKITQKKKIVFNYVDENNFYSKNKNIGSTFTSVKSNMFSVVNGRGLKKPRGLDI